MRYILNIEMYRLTYVLFQALKLYPGINYKNDWKLINIQIGSKLSDCCLPKSYSSFSCWIKDNDQCASCIDEFIEVLTPRKFGQHVDAAVSRIKKDVPRVLVNLSKSLCISIWLLQN